MIKFVCILKSGGDFSPKHVVRLKAMIDRHAPEPYEFYCLTDMSVPGVRCVSLIHELPGKWSMWEAFRITGKVIVMGLDTIVLGSLKPLFEMTDKIGLKEFGMINSFNPRRQYANGIMVWNGDWSHLLTDYDASFGLHNYKLEQEYTIYKLRQERVAIVVINQNVSGVYSYKKHCKDKLPQDARIILFHGTPRPDQVSNVKWIKENYLI